MSNRHLCVVSANGPRQQSAAADHAEWHRTGDACLLCGRVSWHSCPLLSPGLSDRGWENADCWGKGN